MIASNTKKSAQSEARVRFLGMDLPSYVVQQVILGIFGGLCALLIALTILATVACKLNASKKNYHRPVVEHEMRTSNDTTSNELEDHDKQSTVIADVGDLLTSANTSGILNSNSSSPKFSTQKSYKRKAAVTVELMQNKSNLFDMLLGRFRPNRKYESTIEAREATNQEKRRMIVENIDVHDDNNTSLIHSPSFKEDDYYSPMIPRDNKPNDLEAQNQSIDNHDVLSYNDYLNLKSFKCSNDRDESIKLDETKFSTTRTAKRNPPNHQHYLTFSRSKTLKKDSILGESCSKIFSLSYSDRLNNLIYLSGYYWDITDWVNEKHENDQFVSNSNMSPPEPIYSKVYKSKYL